MPTIIPISQARANLPQLVEEVNAFAIEKYLSVGGTIKVAMVDANKFANMQATLEILSDPEAMEAIRLGQIDIANGDLIDWDTLKEELDL